MARSNTQTLWSAVVAFAVFASSNVAVAENAPAPAPKVLHFRARVDIAADGATRVTADESVPVALRQPIESQVGSWRFEPVLREGRPVSATTWVGALACLVPEGDKLRLSVGYENHGPGRPLTTQFSPSMPPGSLMRAGINTTLQVFYTVQPDGRGAFERVDFDPSVPEQFRPWFDKTMRQMVKVQRFEPERLDGQAVATRMQVPVQMAMAPANESRLTQLRRQRAERDAQLLRDQLSPACVAAAGDAPEVPVALDSPVRLLQSAPARGS